MKGKDAIALLARRIQALEARVKQLEADAADDFEVDADILNTDTPPSPAPVQDDVGEVVQTPEGPARVGQVQSVRQKVVEPGPAGTPSVVNIPEATEDERKLRKRLLDKLALENLPPEHGIDKPTADAAYVRGGPAWLYNFDRDYVMTLSPEVRAAIVQDMAQHDPDYAQEMGRDMLRTEDVVGSPGSALGVAEDAAKAAWATEGNW